MMKFKSYILLLLFYILQTTLISRFEVFGATVDLVFILAVCFAMTNPPLPSSVFALFCGLFLDFSSGKVFGINAIIVMYTAFLVSELSEKYFYCNLRSTVMWTFLSTFFYQLVFCLLNFVIWGYGPFSYIIYKIIVICVLNSAFSIVYYFVFMRSKFIREQMLFD